VLVWRSIEHVPVGVVRNDSPTGIDHANRGSPILASTNCGPFFFLAACNDPWNAFLLSLTLRHFCMKRFVASFKKHVCLAFAFFFYFHFLLPSSFWMDMKEEPRRVLPRKPSRFDTATFVEWRTVEWEGWESKRKKFNRLEEATK